MLAYNFDHTEFHVLCCHCYYVVAIMRNTNIHTYIHTCHFVHTLLVYAQYYTNLMTHILTVVSSHERSHRRHVCILNDNGLTFYERVVS
jgi:hypothetical protein